MPTVSRYYHDTSIPSTARIKKKDSVIVQRPCFKHHESDIADFDMKINATL